jgi:hypothetical protein
MEVAALIDIYTSVLGWTLYDRLWEALLGSGLAYLPFLGAIVRHFAGSWSEAGDAGAEASVRGLELQLLGMIAVAALAGAPAVDLKVADLTYTAACGDSTVRGGATGTLYDSTFNIGGGAPAQVPVWWRAVMAVAAGVSNVAVAALPCSTNLRQLNYRVDNTRVADPALRRQLQQFDRDCYQPARAKFDRDHQNLPPGYGPGDTDWAGSRFFQDTGGYYDDPNPNIAPRAGTEIPGFPYDPGRDFEYGGTPPASGFGKPTCRQWWIDPSVGLRKRLLDQIDPKVLTDLKSAAAAAAKPPTAVQVEDAQVRRLFLTEARVLAISGGSDPSWLGLLFSEPGDWLVGLARELPSALATAGTAYYAVEQRATFYALQQAAPIGQSLILMAVYLCLPFVLVFSSYAVETALLAALGIFALRFLTALWALATWIDSAMTKALGIEWWHVTGDEGIAKLVAQMVGALLFMGLPVVWFLVLGWAGHHLAASGLAGAMSEGVGRAAGAGVRMGGKLLKGVARAGK